MKERRNYCFVTEIMENKCCRLLAFGAILLVIAIFVLIPVIYSAGLSLYSWDMLRPTPTFVGVDNYQRLFTNEEFYHSLKITFLFAAMTVPLSMVIALIFALLLDQGSKKLMVTYRSMFSPNGNFHRGDISRLDVHFPSGLWSGECHYRKCWIQTAPLAQ